MGPIDARHDEIVDRVRANLHATDTDEWVASAVDSAISYVTTWTDRAELGLPDDELTVGGLVVFATRIYLDGFSPNGAHVGVSDFNMEPIYQPEDLYKHVHHYFDHLTLAWGVA